MESVVLLKMQLSSKLFIPMPSFDLHIICLTNSFPIDGNDIRKMQNTVILMMNFNNFCVLLILTDNVISKIIFFLIS